MYSRFLGVLCALAFAVCAPIGVLAFNVDHNILSAPKWLAAAEEADLRGGMITVVTNQLSAAPDSPLANLPPEDVHEIATGLLPTEVLQPVIEQAITALVAFGRAERDDVSISMTDFKREMQTRFPTVLQQMLADKPVCANRAEYNSYSCRPRPQDQAEFDQRVREGAAHAWGDLPETHTFISADSLTAEQLEVRAGFVRIMTLSPYLALVLGLLIAVFAVRGVRGLLLWIGIPLLVAGLLLFCVWGMGEAIQLGVLETLSENTGNADSDAANAALAPVFEVVAGDFVRGLMAWAAAVAATGFGMTIAGALMPRAQATEAA